MKSISCAIFAQICEISVLAKMQYQTSTHITGFALIPKFNMLALTAAIEPLRVANYLAGEILYDWYFVSGSGGTIKASNGMSIETDSVTGDKRKWNSIIVCGSWNVENYEDGQLFNWLRLQDNYGVTLGGMCMGAYVLAKAKLLSGYDATVHWSWIPGFKEQYPNVALKEQLFVIDRNRVTSAGGTAGIDMMLHLIEKHHGVQLTQEVAEQILHDPIREAESSQRKVRLGNRKSLHPTIRECIILMENNLEEVLPIPYIAKVMGVSQRKLERLFRQYLGTSAIGFYRILRLQFSRALLTQTSMSIREISLASGFPSFSHFAKSFTEEFGNNPSQYREAWPVSESVPRWPGMSSSLIKFRNVAKAFNNPPQE
ncbi:MAG: GlxA family transcriptional regulator [Gammaproteobacteria bacterium]|nr:GlxA family transcriptional regulator [Gammaproteobacteria bacterium]